MAAGVKALFGVGCKVKNSRKWQAAFVAGLLVLGVLFVFPGTGRSRAEDYRILRCRMLARDFMAELRDELLTAIREQGPVSAVAVCRQLVPELTARYSLPPGIDVKLTSWDCCNPANRPDAWEKRGMDLFSQRRRAGGVLAGMDYWQEVDGKAGPSFRYLRALPTGSLCLQCHGEHLRAKLRQALRRAGAGGQKKGSRLGELRGVLSITLSP